MIKKLKVCHFTYSFLPLVGGMEEVIHSLSISMSTQGCEPYVFAPYVRGKDNRLDVPYKVLRYQRPSSRRFGLRQLLIPLLWHHFKYRFDIIHCHGVYPPGYVAMAFYRITGVPFIVTSHGGDIKVSENGFIVNKRVSERVQKTFACAHAVTAISEQMKEKVIQFGARSDRVFVIPNGIALEQSFLKTECLNKSTGNHPYILFLGRLHKIKRIDILLKSFSMIHTEFPDVRLIIAGAGTEKAHLQSLAHELGIGHKTDFRGTVRGYEKHSLLANALFFVCPQVIHNIGIANLEAMAAGLPIIIGTSGKSMGMFRDGEDGFIVDPESSVEISDKMRLLLRNATLRKQMGGNAAMTASRYDWSVIVREYLDVYRKLL